MKRTVIGFFRLLFARGKKAKTRVRRSEAQLRRVRTKKTKPADSLGPTDKWTDV